MARGKRRNAERKKKEWGQEMEEMKTGKIKNRDKKWKELRQER